MNFVILKNKQFMKKIKFFFTWNGLKLKHN